ncbi:MAG: GNAT family N-acetyltransferase [Chitinophagaceae bacterium]
MVAFSDPHISIASLEDAAIICNLLNKAYRGESSKKGWTTEADLIEGEVRASEEHVRDVMKINESVFLKYISDNGTLIGCVNLQRKDRGFYLGMFSVDPDLQGAGIGKNILKAAEELALQSACFIIYMYVISRRSELIAWYNRHGYTTTNEIVPFNEDAMSGKHKQKLEFLILEKHLH